MAPKIVAETQVKKDARNRITLPGAEFERYAVRAFADGHYEVYPQILVDATIDRATLDMIDTAAENLARGQVGDVVDPGAMLAALSKGRAKRATTASRKAARG